MLILETTSINWLGNMKYIRINNVDAVKENFNQKP